MMPISRKIVLKTADLTLSSIQDFVSPDIFQKVDFGEIVCQIFDDSGLSDGLELAKESGVPLFSESIDVALIKFSHEIDDFDSSIGQDKFLIHPSWKKIRQSGIKCAQLLENYLKDHNVR